MTDQIQETNPEIKSMFVTDKLTLVQIAKSVYSLGINESSILISNEGLSFRGMDNSHVCLIDMGLPNTIFENFETNQDLKITVKTDSFLKLVNSLDTKGSITIEATTKKIIIKQNGLSTVLENYEPSEIDYPLPKIPYDTNMSLSNETTKEIIKVLKQFAKNFDYITFNQFDEQFCLSSKSDDKESSSKTYGKNEIDFKSWEQAETTFSLEYISEFLKTLNAKSEIQIMYSNSKPLRIQTSINNLGRIDFYLAPRIEN